MALEIREYYSKNRPLTTKQRIIFVLTSLIIGLAMFAVAYIGMRQNVGIGYFNQPVLDWMMAHRSDNVTAIAKFVTNLASPAYLVPATGVFVVIWVLAKREFWRPFVLTAAIGVSALTSFVLKLLIKDVRPPVENMVPAFEFNYSFPSGHTIGIVVLMMVLGYLFYSRHFNFFRLLYWGLGTVLIGTTIGVSRLYLGYHWLTDVIASAGLGFIILALFIIIDTIVTRNR